LRNQGNDLFLIQIRKLAFLNLSLAAPILELLAQALERGASKQYRPKFRDGSYLVELVGSLFSGSFTSKRAVRGSISGNAGAGADKVAPTGSAASSVDRQSDTLVFSGSPDEVSKLKKILPQVDVPVGDVLVRCALRGSDAA
jgi:type II secretory pathway component GspD/PulD (secretin)